MYLSMPELQNLDDYMRTTQTMTGLSPEEKTYLRYLVAQSMKKRTRDRKRPKEA